MDRDSAVEESYHKELQTQGAGADPIPTPESPARVLPKILAFCQSTELTGRSASTGTLFSTAAFAASAQSAEFNTGEAKQGVDLMLNSAQELSVDVPASIEPRPTPAPAEVVEPVIQPAAAHAELPAPQTETTLPAHTSTSLKDVFSPILDRLGETPQWTDQSTKTADSSIFPAIDESLGALGNALSGRIDGQRDLATQARSAISTAQGAASGVLSDLNIGPASAEPTADTLAAPPRVARPDVAQLGARIAETSSAARQIGADLGAKAGGALHQLGSGALDSVTNGATLALGQSSQLLSSAMGELTQAPPLATSTASRDGADEESAGGGLGRMARQAVNVAAPNLANGVAPVLPGPLAKIGQVADVATSPASPAPHAMARRGQQTRQRTPHGAAKSGGGFTRRTPPTSPAAPGPMSRDAGAQTSLPAQFRQSIGPSVEQSVPQPDQYLAPVVEVLNGPMCQMPSLEPAGGPLMSLPQDGQVSDDVAVDLERLRQSVEQAQQQIDGGRDEQMTLLESDLVCQEEVLMCRESDEASAIDQGAQQADAQICGGGDDLRMATCSRIEELRAELTEHTTARVAELDVTRDESIAEVSAELERQLTALEEAAATARTSVFETSNAERDALSQRHLQDRETIETQAQTETERARVDAETQTHETEQAAREEVQRIRETSAARAAEVRQAGAQSAATARQDAENRATAEEAEYAQRAQAHTQSAQADVTALGASPPQQRVNSINARAQNRAANAQAQGARRAQQLRDRGEATAAQLERDAESAALQIEADAAAGEQQIMDRAATATADIESARATAETSIEEARTSATSELDAAHESGLEQIETTLLEAEANIDADLEADRQALEDESAAALKAIEDEHDAAVTEIEQTTVDAIDRLDCGTQEDLEDLERMIEETRLEIDDRAETARQAIEDTTAQATEQLRAVGQVARARIAKQAERAVARVRDIAHTTSEIMSGVVDQASAAMIQEADAVEAQGAAGIDKLHAMGAQISDELQVQADQVIAKLEEDRQQADEPLASDGLDAYEVVPDGTPSPLGPNQIRQSQHDGLVEHGFDTFQVVPDSFTGPMTPSMMRQSDYDRVQRGWLNMEAGTGGMTLNGSDADQDTYRDILADGIGRSEVFRDTYSDIVEDTANPTTANIGRDNAYWVDSFATNNVDLNDLDWYGTNTNATYDWAQTQNEIVLHFIEERHFGVVNGGGFQPAHQHALGAGGVQERYRQEQGQPNRIVSQVGTPAPTTANPNIVEGTYTDDQGNAYVVRRDHTNPASPVPIEIEYRPATPTPAQPGGTFPVPQ